MRHITLLAASLAAVLALAAPARAGMAEDCAQDRDQDLKIGNCTAVIRSGQWIGEELAWAYYNRGLAYRKLGENRRAIEDYDQALRLDPGYAHAYNNRGVVHDDLGQYRRAIEDYDQALRVDPGYANAYQNRGVSRESLGQYERAAVDWEQAIRYGGASMAKWWQGYLKEMGHYSGAIDGAFDPELKRGLRACAIDPAC